MIRLSCTNIYVDGERFKQCKFILLEFSPCEMKSLDEIRSIDEVAENLDFSEEWRRVQEPSLIPPDVEFWGHCSNL